MLLQLFRSFPHIYRGVYLEVPSHLLITHFTWVVRHSGEIKSYMYALNDKTCGKCFQSLNSDGHQFHQYKQDKQSPQILTEPTELKSAAYCVVKL